VFCAPHAGLLLTPGPSDLPTSDPIR